jgi:hypothetical protein
MTSRAVSKTTGYCWRTSFSTTKPSFLQRLLQASGPAAGAWGRRKFGASEFANSSGTFGETGEAVTEVAGLFTGMVVGMFDEMGYGLVVGLLVGLSIAFGTTLIGGLGLVPGLVVGLVPQLVVWLDVDAEWLSFLLFVLVMSGMMPIGLGAGLGAGLVYKLSAGFAAGLSGDEIDTKTMPNEGIHRSARMAVISGLVFGLGAGLGGGLFAGIRYGGRTCLQHLLLRLTLKHDDSAPWRYVDFLDYAAERLFLHKVGGGYRFIHRLLQDYFAARYTELGSVAPQEPAERASSAPS